VVPVYQDRQRSNDHHRRNVEDLPHPLAFRRTVP
jgi:hypothetical protein